MDLRFQLPITPSELDILQKSHNLFDEADVDFLNFYTDIFKAKDIQNLIPVKKLIHKKGKLFQQTIYIDPNKKKDEASYSKEYRNAITKERLKKTGTLRLGSHLYNKGDKVEFTMQDGSKGIGEFRHIAVNKNSPDGNMAVIRAKIKRRNGTEEYKTIGRKLQDIKLVDKTSIYTEQPERVASKGDTNIGDRVKFSVREKTPEGIRQKEVFGTLTRFRKNDGKGDLVTVTLDDGKIVERYLHNIVKTDNEKVTPLTKEQEVLLNKAISRVKNENKGNYSLIEVFKKRKDGAEKIKEIEGEIEINNTLLSDYIDVFKGNKNFTDIIKEVPEVEEIPEEKPEVKKPEQIIPEPEVVDEKVIEEARVRGMVNFFTAKIDLSKRNIARDQNKTDFISQRNVYVAKKNLQENMYNLIKHKEENNLPLTAEEIEFKDSPKEELIKPVKPIESVGDTTVEVPKKTKTITTFADNVKKKKDTTVDAIIERINKMDLSDKKKKSLIKKYTTSY